MMYRYWFSPLWDGVTSYRVQTQGEKGTEIEREARKRDARDTHEPIQEGSGMFLLVLL